MGEEILPHNKVSGVMHIENDLHTDFATSVFSHLLLDTSPVMCSQILPLEELIFLTSSTKALVSTSPCVGSQCLKALTVR